MATKTRRRSAPRATQAAGFDVTLVVIADHPPTNSLRIYNREVRLPFVPQLKMTILLGVIEKALGAEEFEVGEVSYDLETGKFSAVMQTGGYRDAKEDEFPWPKLGFEEQMPRHQHRK